MDWGNCKKCNCELTFKTIHRVFDLDHSKLGYYCLDCGEHVEEELKQSRFVEEYKGNYIYQKDGKYSPYWKSNYYFISLDNCRARIDNNMVGVYPAQFFN